MVDPEPSGEAILPASQVRREVLQAWRKSLRLEVAGLVVIAVVAAVVQWLLNDATEKAWDGVTGSTFLASIIAIGVWLALLTVWHVVRTPLRLARAEVGGNRTELTRLRARAGAEAKATPGHLARHLTALHRLRDECRDAADIGADAVRVTALEDQFSDWLTESKELLEDRAPEVATAYQRDLRFLPTIGWHPAGDVESLLSHVVEASDAYANALRSHKGGGL